MNNIHVFNSDGAQADLNDKNSLREAFKGAHGVFGVTNFWDTLSGDKEVAQGKNIADACKVRTHSNSFSPYDRALTYTVRKRTSNTSFGVAF